MKKISVQQLNSASPAQWAEILNGPSAEIAAWLAAAAEQGVTSAQANYGHKLLDGIGLAPDPEQALHWFKVAAHAEHVMAINMVGRCYENGWGTAANQDIATYWFRLAANRGLDWGMYNYATSLTLGRGTESNRPQAFEWFNKAANLGHAKSLNILGGFYEDGWEVDPDLAIAFDYYRQAAQGGDFRGQFNYARLLADQGNVTESVVWMKRVPETATPAFLIKVRHFLASAPQTELRDLAI